MKKTMKFIGLIAMAALLFSCEKKNIDTPVENPQGTETPSDLSQLDPSKYLVSFGATIESPATKATIGFEEDPELGKVAKVTFNENDEVLVVSGTETATYHYDGTQFIPNQPESPLAIGENGITVYYPKSEPNPDPDPDFKPVFSFSEGTVTFTMPKPVEDLADLGKKAPMAAQIVQDGDSFKAEFKNICSVLQVNVTADVNITSVMLNFGNSNKYAEGAKFNIGWNDKDPTMAVSQQASTSGVTVEVTPAKTAEAFFILPTVALSEGLEVTANLTEDNNGGARSYTVTNASTNAPLRNSISKMSFYAGLFSGGAGTSEDPYKIATARDFRNLITYSTKGCPQCSKNASDFLGAHYQQTADINFKDKKMSPISDFDNRFGGTYDGCDNELQNVNIDETGAIAAVFATLNGSGEIKNLTVSGNVTKTGATENSLAAGIVGIVYDNAKITNCTNKATISSSATYTGGIVGRLYGAGSGITNCVNYGDVSSSTSYSGGITGRKTTGLVQGCFNHGSVEGTSLVGGITGHNEAGSILESVNTGNISSAGYYAGGITGYITGGYIVDCFAKGAVSGSRNTGGLVGYAYAEKANVGIFNSVASADVETSFGEADSGAFIGRASNAGSYFSYIGNCACINGSFTATDGSAYRVAAFIGFTNTGSGSNYNRVRVWNSYTTIQESNFNVTTSATTNYGGFIGRMNNQNSLCDCYFVCDNTHSAVNSKNVKNLTKISVSQMNGTEDLTIAGPMGQDHKDQTGKFVEILNIGNKQNDVNNTPLRAFNTYDFCDWTTTGANSEALTYPVPETLVALGETHYK